ncbi:protein GRAVITROPIC IN THE LIGHT 1 [Euphorbia lathyris]|uniref:protein GRAVITROPIC IN THE LIGHT 1 n=1 Tax=Euphorbia lathyris TaxID=212925 RepID=UPI0033139531
MRKKKTRALNSEIQLNILKLLLLLLLLPMPIVSFFLTFSTLFSFPLFYPKHTHSAESVSFHFPIINYLLLRFQINQTGKRAQTPPFSSSVMESVAVKPSKPSSNISEMVTKFAKVCKLRSIGVFYNENPIYNNVSTVVDGGGGAAEETEGDGRKIHPIHPQPALVSSKSDICGEEYILELFDALSSLKLAYIQLQEAHVPYDPDKISAADEHIVAQLEALHKIKRTYKEKEKEKQFGNDTPVLAEFDCLQAEIEVNEQLLENLKSLRSAKDYEIVNLRRKLHDLDSENAALIEKIREKSLERENARVLNVGLFEETFRKASMSIHDFAKPIIGLMKASGWDLDLAANSIETGVSYSKRSHKKYIFEACIARKMFHGISLNSYNVDDIMKFDDPIDALIENPNSGFADFCRKKYLLLVHPVMEMSFFGNLDQRMLLLSDKHPRTQFYQIFSRMAKWVWILQGIAKTIDSEAEIFAPKRGNKFSDVYMEPVETDALNGGIRNLVVQFMVMPGFRIGDALIKSLVYVSDTS